MVSSGRDNRRKKAAAMVRTLKDKICKRKDNAYNAGCSTMRARALARWAMRQFDDQEYGRCLEILSKRSRGVKALKHMLLLRPGIASASEGRTRGALLNYAVSYRRGFDFVVALLEAGADPNARSKHLDWTPLFHTIENSKYGASVVTSLLEHGADPNAKSAEGMTALHHAARCNNVAICKLLIAAGSDVNAIDNRGRTALKLAGKNPPAYKCIETLLAGGAKVTRSVTRMVMWWGSPRGLQMLFRAERRSIEWAFSNVQHKCVSCLCINVEYLNRIRKAAVDAQFVRLDAMTAAEDRDRFARSVDALITNAPSGFDRLFGGKAIEFAGYEAYERDQRRALATIVQRIVGHRVPAEISDIIVAFWGHPGGYVLF